MARDGRRQLGGPSPRLSGDESLLAQHLVDGQRILREAPEPDLTPPTTTSADSEHLRWFDLPRVSVEG